MALTKRKKLLLLLWLRRKLRRSRIYNRRYAVHPINKKRFLLGEYHHLLPQLVNDEDKFIEYFRMEPSTFRNLLDLCEEDLTKMATNFQTPISAKERLVVTLRFLATGDSFVSLAFRFRLGKATVRKIVKESIQSIWIRLQPSVMPIPSEADWKEIANDFFTRWNFPLCCGAIDGKHVQIKAPAYSGSQFYNYKGHHSIVLLAIVDAKGKFIAIDVGAYGSSSDGGVFQNSTFYKRLKANQLNLPETGQVPNTNIDLPYVFVGDEAFPLMRNVMKPFPRRNLDDGKRIYNYRHSRARRQVECTFGVTSSMWRILRKPIEVAEDFACDIVKAICALHNFIHLKEPARVKQMSEDFDFSTDTTVDCFANDIGRPKRDAIAVRMALTEYFTSPLGSVAWQYDMI